MICVSMTWIIVFLSIVLPLILRYAKVKTFLPIPDPIQFVTFAVMDYSISTKTSFSLNIIIARDLLHIILLVCFHFSYLFQVLSIKS